VAGLVGVDLARLDLSQEVRHGSSTDSAMTNATTTTSRAEITPAVSMEAAVGPPISAVTPVPETARGTTVSLR
jgi:hypothetical protein